MLEHQIHFIGNQEDLIEGAGWLDQVGAFALDIETINWWNRDAERISLVQLALRMETGPVVLLIDALAGIDLEPLRRPLELGMQIKAIHNASFDAVKLARYYGIATSPIHDTMLAARRSGEKKCSLKAQVEKHLGIALDKGEQRSDWGRRPLTEDQLRYAALDALSTLLLYERQSAHGLIGDYQLKYEVQIATRTASDTSPVRSEHLAQGVAGDLTTLAIALLGIVIRLEGRYSPEQLIASVGSERVGLAGWLLDHHLGPDADVDEEIARQEIASLAGRGLLRITESRRLEATEDGRQTYSPG